MNEPVTPSQIKLLDLTESEIKLANADEFYGDYYRKCLRIKEENQQRTEDPKDHEPITYTRAAIREVSRATGRAIRQSMALLILPLVERLRSLESRYLESQAKLPMKVDQSSADPRSFEFTLANGTRSFFYLPVPLYKGIYQARQSYIEGDMVSFKGNLFHCNAKTTSATPATSQDWQLCVRAGADGKDLRNV